MKRFHNIDSFRHETYEYAFSSVPEEKRKDTSRLLLIFAGFSFSTSGLTIGGVIGNEMMFYEAIGICFVGNLILFLTALFWGMLGYKSGYTSVFLVKKLLGDKIAFLFSILIISAVIMWVGVNGDLLARIIISSFPRWPFPISVTILMAMSMGIICSSNGWKNMEVMNKIVLPFILLLTAYSIICVGEMKGGYDFLFRFRPNTHITVVTALTMIIGNFSLSATTMPDVCRFAKNKQAVFACAAVYAVVLFISNLTGILIVQATGADNLNYGIYLLGMVVPCAVWLILCTYTTQNVNVYTGSLAIQNLVSETVMGGNISHRMAVLFIGGVSGIIGIMGITKYLPEITGILVATVMPLTGIAFVAVRKKQYKDGVKKL